MKVIDWIAFYIACAWDRITDFFAAFPWTKASYEARERERQRQHEMTIAIIGAGSRLIGAFLSRSLSPEALAKINNLMPTPSDKVLDAGALTICPECKALSCRHFTKQDGSAN